MKGDVVKTDGEKTVEQAWWRSRGNSMVTCMASRGKHEPSWPLKSFKGDTNLIYVGKNDLSCASRQKVHFNA